MKIAAIIAAVILVFYPPAQAQAPEGGGIDMALCEAEGGCAIFTLRALERIFGDIERKAKLNCRTGI